jgi:acetoin utilization deacetylase AcuC-like enzyme
MFGILLDDIYKKHDTGAHPERAERLAAIEEGLKQFPDLEYQRLAPVRAEVGAIALVHDADYVQGVQERVEAGAHSLDPDTQVSADSFEVALHAVGGSLAGIDAIVAGKLRQAFFAVRPPGHHAERSKAMGFCLFNNVAIAAAHLVKTHGLSRVAVFDFDVHHGNGTMHSFYEDPSVFYASVHQWPLYPGTGHPQETGRGKGLGTTLNMPYPAGAGDAEYVEAARRFGDAMEKFKPEFLLVSAGFDGHWADPLAGHEVTENGYVAVARELAALADAHCDGRLALFLEGGYNLAALKNCTSGVIRTLIAKLKGG